MNASGLIAAATLAAVAAVAAITWWPARADRSASATNAPHPNTSWSRAAAQTSSTASPQFHGVDPGAAEENSSDSPSGEGSQAAPAPPAHAVTMQDGTVIWAAERERAGSPPARER